MYRASSVFRRRASHQMGELGLYWWTLKLLPSFVIKNSNANKQTKQAAVDNLVHRLFCKCVKIPVDELLEVEMLGQRTHACPYNLCFLKLPLIFPPMLTAEASSHAFLKLQEPLLIQDDFLRGHYLLLTPLVGSSEDLATVPVSSYILSPSYHFSSLKVTTIIISGFFASRVMLYICMQIYMLYIQLCMYTYEHTCTRPFPPFYISGSISTPKWSNFKGIPPSSNHHRR